MVNNRRYKTMEQREKDLRIYASSELVKTQTETMKAKGIVKQLQKEGNHLVQIKAESIINKMEDFEVMAEQLRKMTFDFIRYFNENI